MPTQYDSTHVNCTRCHTRHGKGNYPLCNKRLHDVWPSLRSWDAYLQSKEMKLSPDTLRTLRNDPDHWDRLVQLWKEQYEDDKAAFGVNRQVHADLATKEWRRGFVPVVIDMIPAKWRENARDINAGMVVEVIGPTTVITKDATTREVLTDWEGYLNDQLGYVNAPPTDDDITEVPIHEHPVVVVQPDDSATKDGILEVQATPEAPAPITPPSAEPPTPRVDAAYRAAGEF